MEQRLFHQKSGGEARMKTGHWLMSMFYVPLSGLMLLVWRQEGHPAGKNPAPLIPEGSLPAQDRHRHLFNGVFSRITW